MNYAIDFFTEMINYGLLIHEGYNFFDWLAEKGKDAAENKDKKGKDFVRARAMGF